jgi:gentisate 1,2-dioxygenase
MRVITKKAWCGIGASLFINVGLANPPTGITPDPSLQAWFQSLKEPTSHQPCCSISDCRFSPYEVRDGHYEIKVDDWTYVVPDTSVLRAANNPFHKAVVCYSNEGIGVPERPFQDSLRIHCFLPPNPTS